MRYIFLVVLSTVLFSSAPAALAASAWPVASATTISSNLTSTLPPSGRVFEPSDIAILGSGVVLVSDEGDVATMNDDGSELSEWLLSSGADLEGVAVSNDTLYVLHERERDVFAYNLTTHERLATYDLSPWISGNDNLGPEGLTISDTTLYVGHQATGVIYEFNIASGSPSLITSWSTGINVQSLSLAEDEKLYVMGSGVLRAYNADRSYQEYALPSQPQPEGVALRVNCSAGTASLFIANDTGPVYRYDNFPVSCPVATPAPEPEPVVIDADNDGVASESDCNDSDASVSSDITYFRDADSDTLGNLLDTTSVCLSVAPSGYVANSTDNNDAQAYFSGVGTVNGSIIVTYGDGSSKLFQVYATTTSTVISSVYQYKDSSYLIVKAPFNMRIAVVDPYTGQVKGMRWIPGNVNVLNRWFVSIIGY